MPAFILEIGTEELPARFLDNAQAELATKVGDTLTENGVAFSGLQSYATPRRLVLYIEDLAVTSLAKEEVVIGPPVKAAFDVGGRPTRAAEGFAKTHGVTLDDVFTQETEKGAYLAVRKTVGGGATHDILASVCSPIIASLSFPKRMSWGSSSFTFARPLRWILAMHGDQIIPFTVGLITSGNYTCGHRVHGPGPFALADASQYFTVVAEKGGVIVSNKERRATIKQQANALVEAKNGVVLWKESLLDEVQGLCEHPVPILGTFDPSFLEVPREVLLTSMESHQKSFGVESASGSLLPYFVTVLNITPLDYALVQKGWERVLRARLEDARFFWKTDRAASFDGWLTALDSVIFLAPLGSMGDKTKRISALCGWLAENLGYALPHTAVSKEDAMRAGRLSKADLVSEMVKEFDTLQGIMGGIYASHANENDVVSTAIAEQYLPAGPDSPVPSSLCGAIVSIADKADTLAGCFGLGMVPSGTADPYALRRAVLGIARIVQEKGLRLNLQDLFAQAVSGYGNLAWKVLPEQSLPRLQEFFTQRLKNHYIAAGHETLIAEACLLASANDIWSTTLRIEAMTKQSKTAEFEPAVLTFKRLANIIKKQTQDSGTVLTGKYNSALLQEQAEKDLASAYEAMATQFDALWNQENYADLFAVILEVRPVVDAFFENVMVMCDDEAIRANRLNLLFAVVDRIAKLADFSALQI